MKRSLLAAVALAGFPALAHAQRPPQPAQVPALVQAEAAASANGLPASPAPGSAAIAAASASGPGSASAQAQAGAVPATMPPPVPLLSPSAPLNTKERAGVAIAYRWAERAELPQPGEDGVVRFLFGATLPTVVCAPYQVCDLALQPGEIVNTVNLGDKVRWNVAPALSGSADGQITHLIVKPVDAGLASSMTIETNRRTYAVKLVSTQHDWMPLVAFMYPDDMQRQWSAYQQAVATNAAPSGRPGAPAAAGLDIANLDFGYRLSGDHPAWRPVRVFTDGSKTVIQFPRALASGTAPVLVALNRDGGWFSDPTQRMVIYRPVGDRFVVDEVLDRAELIAGVGDSQTRVVITREGAQ